MTLENEAELGGVADSDIQRPATPATTEGPEATIREFNRDYKRALHDLLPEFKGRELVKYQWHHQNGGEGSLSVTLTDVAWGNRENAVPRMKLKLSAGVDSAVEVEDVMLSPTLTEDEVWLRLFMPDADNVSKAFKEVRLAEAVPPVEARLETRLARPNVPSSMDFAIAFFGDGRVPGMEVIRKVDPDLERHYPAFDSQSKDKWKLALPPRDPFNAHDWTATSLAFLAWGLVTSVQGARENHSLTARFLPLRRAALPAEECYLPPKPGTAVAGTTRRDSRVDSSDASAPVTDPARGALGSRPVDLSVEDILKALDERTPPVKLPWHVVEAACTSLNSGKHVILTGPPGCGKTELAVALARRISGEKGGLVATASPSWTTGDLIGRYFPTLEGNALEFRAGFFLRAVREQRCLVIDEFNRARIDDCFGELFTVLSGQNVELPYEVYSKGQRRHVRIVVNGSTASAPEGNFEDYNVRPDFRLLGTMNDADRADLSQLSFALLRRVDIIRVDAPAPNELRGILGRTLEDQLDHSEHISYSFRRRDGVEESAVELVSNAFSTTLQGAPLQEDEGDSSESGFALQLLSKLVAERIIGVATAIDIIRFVVEGMRCASTRNICLVTGKDEPRHVVLSYLAMAVVLKVFPQLDGIDWDRRQEIIQHIVKTFSKQKASFLRIRPAEGDYHFRVEPGLGKEEQKAPGGTLVDFLIGELRRQYHIERKGRASFLDELAGATP